MKLPGRPGVPRFLATVTGARSEAEDIRDFLGVVEIDQVGRLGILVLPEHVSAVLRVGGTDYASGSVELREEIVGGWAALLNTAGVSAQIFVHRARIAWDLPGGFLDLMRAQVEADFHSDWQLTRYERMETALLAGELDGFPVMDQRSYIVLRHAIGSSEMRATGRSSVPMYVPPRRGLRFWEKPKTTFGSGERGYEEWTRRRDDAARGLALTVERFLRDIGIVPGLSAEPCGRLEIAQLLHLLWRGERSYDDWLVDESRLNDVLRGDSLLGTLDPAPATHDAPLLPHPRRRARNGRALE